MKNMKSIFALILVLILTVSLLAGCGAAATPGTGVSLREGGVLCLKVNPEIAVHYDADGNVTAVESRNDDAKAIVEAYLGYEGRPAREVVAELVTAIGEAGYFVEEIEGERRQITIEIEPGSSLPTNTFLTDVADEVRTAVSANAWTAPVDLQGTTDYGITDYADTDYGPNNDGVTDYTDYGTATVPATQPAGGYTDYDDTDYGPNNDGVTDYDDTDYYTDSHHTDYGETHHADGHR